jgi:hypothetical protein
MKNQRILVLDFDGVLHSYVSGWKGYSVIPDPPVEGAMEFIERAQDSGFTVAIYSSRSRSFWGRMAMKRWVNGHLVSRLGNGFGDDAYARISWPWFKPSAFVAIDDRAITFTGNWPSIDVLKAFKPWNKPA